MNGCIHAFMTGTAITLSDDDSGDYTEEHGWIDPTWSMTELFDGRNDVSTLFSTNLGDPDLADQVQAVLEKIEPYENDGSGTFYGQEERYGDDGRAWTYAVHFVRKFLDIDRGWVEEEWHPGDLNVHSSYPHEPGYLYDCLACESRCHCTPGHTECIWSGHDVPDCGNPGPDCEEHNGTCD